MKSKLLLYFLLLFSLHSAKAQQWTWFRSDNSGLPSNNILSLSVNDSAIVYAGTISGLGKFKNNIWTKVNVGPYQSPAILRVHTDSNKVFVGTETDGLWGLTNSTWTHYDAFTSGNGVPGIGIDSKDSLFRLDKFGDFDVWNGSGWRQILYFFSQPNNLFVDRSDNVWLLSNNAGMKKYKNGVITDYPGYYLPTDPHLLPSGLLHDMIQDSSGIYWIASRDGLIRFDGTNFSIYTTANSGICSNRLSCVSIDSVGNLWIGTWDAGISKWNGTTWQTFNITNSPLASPLINDMVVDSANRIWIANGYNSVFLPYTGQGVFQLDEDIDLSNGQLPAAPDSLKAVVISVNEVILSWKDNSNNESGFLLERSIGNTNNFQQIKFLNFNSTTYTDLTTQGGNIYYYRIRSVNNVGASSYSNIIQVDPRYCPINVNVYNAYAIAKKVRFGNINNQPFNCLSGYYNYLDQSTNIFKGQTLLLTLAVDRCTVSSDPFIGASVYIDWNSDGDFDDNQELVFTKMNINGKEEFRIAVTVPDNVIPGTSTRMRIRCEDDINPNWISIPPCGYAEETQDYTLNIINPPADFKPTPITVTDVSSHIQFPLWQDNASNETGYIVQRSIDSISFNAIASLPPNTIIYKDTALLPDTKYYYRVYAKRATDSSFSDIIGSTALSADLIRQWQGEVATDGALFAIGAFWDDYNNDGSCDLYVSGVSRLYKNQAAILNNSQFAFNSSSGTGVWGDYDNDGDNDLFVTDNIYSSGGAAPALYENNGSGSFLQPISIIQPDGRINNAVWTDYNNDGFLDLYVSYIDLGYGKLYRNNKNKTFSFVSQFNNTRGYASFVDYDNDGDNDLVATGTGLTRVHKKTDSTFTQDLTTSLVQITESCRGVSWADLDNDGDIDLFLPASSTNGISKVYINNGSGMFTVNSSFFTSIDGLAFGSAWADYDNDGFQDLFVSRSQKKNKFFRNRFGQFSEVPASVLLSENFTSFPYDEMSSAGCAWGDYNNDGFPDLFVAVSAAASRLYLNGANQYNWISVFLKGTVSNKNAIGAKVKIKVNGNWQYRWVESGSGASAHNSFRLEFGLHTAQSIDSLVVYWPSGVTQILTGVQKNQHLVITETSTPTAVNEPPVVNANLYPNPAFNNEVILVLEGNRFLRSSVAKVFDVSGRSGQYSIRSLGGSKYSIELTGLPPGTYWIEIREKQFMVRKKVIVITK
jgi:hypothetical protein